MGDDTGQRVQRGLMDSVMGKEVVCRGRDERESMEW